jgi:hypothetical protein
MTGGKKEDKLFDPTANVISLVEANRVSSEQALAAAVLRINDLAAAESRRVNDLAALRDLFHDKLSNAESKRVDALRAGDQMAIITASGKVADQAAVLAAQVSTMAETLRTQVGSQFDAYTKRLLDVERFQSEGRGRGSFSLPLAILLSAGAGGLIVWILKLSINVGGG